MKYKCFVAMALGHQDSDAIYDKQMKPVAAVKDVDARRVDRIPHNDDIDDKIIEEIKSADLVIADLTYARPSVYFEAGYAERAGTPVIYTCRRDHLTRGADDNLRVHFDLEHRNIIAWEDDADAKFPAELSDRIELVLRNIANSQRALMVPAPIDLTQNVSSFMSQVAQLRAQKGAPSLAEVTNSAPLEYSRIAAAVGQETDAAKRTPIEHELDALLDNLESLSISALMIRDWDTLSCCGDALLDICRRAYHVDKTTSKVTSKEGTWLRVLMAVYSVGTLLVYKSHWAQTRNWILREADWGGVSRKPEYWCDHLRLALARYNSLPGSPAWLGSVAKQIEAHSALLTLFASRNSIMFAVCQYDFLQCLVVASEKARESYGPFPSFGVYGRDYVEPVLSRILSKMDVREQLLKVSDQELARILFGFETIISSGLGARSDWNDSRWGDPTIQSFFKDYRGMAGRG